MTKIVNLPLLNQMTILECDECGQTALNLHLSDDLKTLAYKCIACGFTGYYHGHDDDEIEDESA